MSEDSDYTSDINYPLPHQHNSSAHQFRGEPSYPLNHESREYNQDYGPYDSFDRDEYERRRSFDNMDMEQRGSFERRGSFDQNVSFDGDEMGYVHGDSFERTESFERVSDHYGYERSDTEYERSVQDNRYEDGYDRPIRDYERLELGSHHSSNRDYDSDPDYAYSHRDYERTITNEDSFNDEQRRQYDSRYEQEYYYDSQEQLHKASSYSRESQNYSRELDFYPMGNGSHIGRSDTDSEPLSYNSRPNQRQPLTNVSASLRQG